LRLERGNSRPLGLVAVRRDLQASIHSRGHRLWCPAASG
jgi:hypothetical protein